MPPDSIQQQTPKTTQPINPSLSIPTTDSPVVEMPSEATESSKEVVDIPFNEDDNGAGVQQPARIKEEMKPEELPPSASLPEETPPASQTQTAQMVGNEPIRTQSFIRGLLEKAKLAIQGRKRKKLDKIMNLFAKQSNPSQIKSQFDGANITNDEVEKYLHVSDATATRYLSILEKEGKIKQNGKMGKSVFYMLVK